MDTTTPIPRTAAELVALEARLIAARAKLQERREAERFAAYRWQVEAIWPPGTALPFALSGSTTDAPPRPFDYRGRPAARQLRSSALARHVARPWRLFITLEGGEVAACSCLVPPRWQDDPAFLAAGAERAALAELERRRPKVRAWWQD